MSSVSSGANPTRENKLYLLFLPYMVFFLGYLSIGYYFTYSTEYKSWQGEAIVLLTLLSIVVVYFFVRHAGEAFHRFRSEGNLKRLWHVAVFFTLFFFSGYAFLAACFLLFEGPDICRGEVRVANDSFSKLEADAHTYLPNRDYEAKIDRVKSNESALLQEILNVAGGGNYCGIGKKAAEKFRLLQEDLPGLDYISGTYDIVAVADETSIPSAPLQPVHLVTNQPQTKKNKKKGGGSKAEKAVQAGIAQSLPITKPGLNHNCALDPNGFKNMRDAYEKLINDKIAHHPDISKYQIAERDELLREIDDAAAANRAELGDVQEKLGGVANFIGNLDLYHKGVRGLEKVALAYSPLRIRFAAMEPKNANSVPEAINAAACERIASYGGVASTIALRSGNPRTWAYVVFAFLADFLAAYLASSVFARSEAIKAQNIIIERYSRVPGSNDVEYVWVPERHPDQKTAAPLNERRETEVQS